MKNRIRDYIVILIFTSIILIPLMNSNFNIYGDDGIQHIARLMGTKQSIAEEGVFSNIMSNFCNGFGYSWNIFYSPLTAYVPLIFSIFTSSFELMLKLFILLIVFSSGIAMYEFVNKLTKNNYAALLASIIYVLVPYRLTDIYMRVAISELASFVFLPITFHGMYNIFNVEEKNTKKSLLLTFGAVGLILTHTIIAMYTAIICFVYMIVHFKQLKNKQVLKLLGINILLIILLTAFYLIPLLEHKLATNYEVFQPGRMERTDVLTFYKVDLLDLVYTSNNSLCFEIGLVTLIGLIFTILAYKKIDKSYRTTYWFFFITGIICIIMSLRFFPFEKLPGILKMLQFTFRLLEFSSFFFAIVVAINYSLVIKNFKMKDVVILGGVALLLIIPLSRNIDFEKKWSEEKLWPAVKVNDNTGRVHAGCATFEYLPSKAFQNMEYIKNRENKTYILSGNATIENEKKDGTKMEFSVSNIEENTVLELPYIYYLGYGVEVTNDSGEVQNIDTFESENGFVAIKLPETAVKVTVKYEGTLLMKISYVISFVTLIGVILVQFWCIIKNKHSSNVKQKS